MHRAKHILFVAFLGVLGASVAQSQIITTVAGGGSFSRTTESLGAVSRVAVDASGNVYATDVSHHVVWKVTPQGAVSVLASAFNGPTGIAVDSIGNVFVADSSNHRVRRIAPDGAVTTVAGNGTGGFAGDDGQAIYASLMVPQGVTVDRSGNLYIADALNQRVRKVDGSGKITTVAGNGKEGFSGDGGPAVNASLNNPYGLAVDPAGNLYIADTDNHRIRKVGSDGIIVTVAGSGDRPVPPEVTASGRVIPGINWRRPGFAGDGGPALLAQLNQSVGIAVDSEYNLYIADTGNSRIRKVDRAGIITTVAGTGRECFSGDGRAAGGAALSQPGGVAVDSFGNLYVADTGNSRIRKIAATGTITTLAGTGGMVSLGDEGPATSASLQHPAGVAVDGAGDLYIADTANHRVRRISAADWVIRTVAGNSASCYSGDDGPATDAPLSWPMSVALDSDGSVIVADHGNSRVRRVSPGGVISTVAQDLNEPWAVAVDSSHITYFSEAGNHRIARVTVGGGMSPVRVEKALQRPGGLAIDVNGDLYISDTGHNQVLRIGADGRTVVLAAEDLRGPGGLALDGAGNLYIADSLNHRVRRSSPDGKIATVAGNGTAAYAGDGGTATQASLNRPAGVAADRDGDLYIADTLNDRIRKVTMPPSFSAQPVLLTLTPGASRQIHLRASRSGLTWQAHTDAAWLRLSAAEGAMPATLSVSVNAAGLAPGSYQGIVEVHCPKATPPVVTVTIQLGVVP